MKRRTSTSPSGFFLLEAMIGIVLLTAFALVAAQLLRAMIVLSHQASGQAAMVSRFDAACGQLRADVWNAAELSRRDRTLVCTVDGHPVTWRIGRDGTLAREAAQGPRTARQSFQELPPDLELRVDGPCVIVRLPPHVREPAEEMRLVSQVLLGNGVTR